MKLQQLQTVVPPLGIQIETMNNLYKACTSDGGDFNQALVKAQQDVFVPAGCASFADAIAAQLPENKKSLRGLSQNILNEKVQAILDAKVTKKVVQDAQLDSTQLVSAGFDGLIDKELAFALSNKIPVPLGELLSLYKEDISNVFLGLELVGACACYFSACFAGSKTLFGFGSFLTFALFVHLAASTTPSSPNPDGSSNVRDPYSQYPRGPYM